MAQEALSADLVIVGGGPAGSSAAEAALRVDPDLRVVVLEKRLRPHGTCAGGVGWNWLEEMGIKLPSHLIERPIDSVAIHGPSETARVTREQIGVEHLGFVIDRWGFDEWLLERAGALGAQVLRGTQFAQIHLGTKKRFRVTCAEGITVGEFTPIQPDQPRFDIETDWVVDASGPQAVVARRRGINVDDALENMHIGLQWTVDLPDSKSSEEIELWFKRDPTPDAPWAVRSGYVWSFPSAHPYWHGQHPSRAGRFTRLGVGVDLANNRIAERSAKRCLEDFRRTHLEFQGMVRSENGGLIPTGRPLETYQDHVFVVGDAGRHCDPLHGGGIFFAVVAGQEAGRAAASGDASGFVSEWRKRIGFTLDSHFAMKRMVYDFSNEDMDEMVRALSEFEIKSADPVREIPRAARVLLGHPRLALKASVAGLRAFLP